MDWRRRLRDIGRAGGLATVAMTMSGCIGCTPACNANPDPCCREPMGAACMDEKACLADGGKLGDYPVDDMGGLTYRCGFPQDLGVPDLSTPVDLAKPHDLATGD
jgi:hypothetical protein